MIPAVPTYSRRLRRTLGPVITVAGQTPGADRSRKHVPAVAHLWILLLHGLSSAPSLRQTYAILDAVPGLWHRLRLRRGLSFSQLARSSTSRPSPCFEVLLADLSARAHRTVVPDASWRLLRKVQAIESTFIRLSAQFSPWSVHGHFTPGVRIQTALDIARGMPTRLRLTLADTNDHEALKAWDLAPWRGWTVLVDLGDYGHRQFARLRAAEVSFLSRLHPQASYRVTVHRAVPVKATPEDDGVLSDETITLGSPNNRAGAVLAEIRLIRSRNRAGRAQAFVTDRFDLTAFELVRLYHDRWRIDLFFRFLKHQLGMTTPLGFSRAAVWLTVLLAAIIALVVALAEATRPPAISRIAWLRGIGQTLQWTLRGGECDSIDPAGRPCGLPKIQAAREATRAGAPQIFASPLKLKRFVRLRSVSPPIGGRMDRLKRLIDVAEHGRRHAPQPDIAWECQRDVRTSFLLRKHGHRLAQEHRARSCGAPAAGDHVSSGPRRDYSGQCCAGMAAQTHRPTQPSCRACETSLHSAKR